MFIVVGVELSVRCKACASPVAINGVKPSAACSSCQREIALRPEFWQLVLGDALEQTAALPMHHESTTELNTETGRVQRVLRRTQISCGQCHMLIPPEEVESLALVRGQIFCGACGNRNPARSMPPDTGLGQVVFLYDEESTADAQVPSQTHLIACPYCGGTLQTDGTSRMVTCKYCAAQTQVPDDIWRRLHSHIHPVRRWFMACRGEARAMPALATWHDVHSAAVDEDGNLYCLGGYDASGQTTDLWSVDSTMHLRWIKRNAPVLKSKTLLVALRNGTVGVWGRDVQGMMLVRCSDGEDAGRFPGAAPGPSRPMPARLGLERCNSVAACSDGTLLVLTEEQRLRGMDYAMLSRANSRGEPVETWPGVPFPPLLEPEGDWPEDFKKIARPPAYIGNGCKEVRMVSGWDDQVYLYTPEWMLKIGSQGTFAWAREIPLKSAAKHRVAADGSGHVHLFAGSGRLIRLDPRGEPAWVLQPRKAGGVIGSEHLIAVDSTGRTTMVGNRGMVRRFGATGSVEFISESARASDSAGA
ncbi:MAG: hypothetical protein HY898_17195 [Deltaproteobacteria bacterium]|nr:hypothetical protein [Deltaproteobacteria bacterium]